MPEHTTRIPPPDPRSPFVLDTRELGRRAGSMRELHREVPAPAGLGSDVVGVAAGAPLELDLRLESVTEGVLVTGSVSAPVSGECGRCLDPIATTETVDLVELFAYPDSTTDATADEDEVSRLVDDLIDLEAVVRDLIVLGLPAPLCRPDCPGMCPGCGGRWDDLPAGHTHDVVDARWASLGSVRDRLAGAPGELDQHDDRTA